MLKSLADWFDNRTGARKLIHEALFEPIPGGARWRYVWGSALVMALVTQIVTGVFLWMFYSPSTTTAWESVYYIQYEATGGWLLRGVHHFMASAMVVLLALHFVQVVWDGAYRAPRELNFVLGVVLMLIVLGLALTGYLLPWDQKGYWATTVGTNLASQAPVVGPELRKLAIGGSDYGHQTLTRFFALHAGVLPGAMAAFLALHIALFRRHGIHAKQPLKSPTAMFWPDQVLKDAVAALGVLAAVLGLTVYYGGAELTAPADPANPYDAARPEWYFLFLFQFLKWFPGETEVWGAFIIPGVVTAVLLAMPWIGRTRRGHVFNVALLCVLLGGAALLTAQAIREDYFAQGTTQDEVVAMNDPAAAARWEASDRFLRAKRQAEHDAERVIELAGGPDRIPPTGALTLVYEDPYLQGPKLYRQYCASCHNHVSVAQKEPDAGDLANAAPTAPNLFGVGSRAWAAALLDPEQIASAHLYGYEGSPFAEGDMVSYVRDEFGDDADEDQQAAVREAFATVAVALSAEAKLSSQHDADAKVAAVVAAGRELMTGGLADVLTSGMSCTDCHKFHDAGELGSAPDLTGYMSREWLIDFIKNPSSERFYGDNNDRMPAFAAHDDPRLNQLDQKSIELIVDWLRGEWARPEQDDRQSAKQE
ncbi:MAG: cytochrome b N-terminal domain-containing protein [Pirellulales bacterium]|nr:cytochrome b N-terminal domain-containing protein [Pirellulales bacterium]